MREEKKKKGMNESKSSFGLLKSQGQNQINFRRSPELENETYLLDATTTTNQGASHTHTALTPWVNQIKK